MKLFYKEFIQDNKSYFIEKLLIVIGLIFLLSISCIDIAKASEIFPDLKNKVIVIDDNHKAIKISNQYLLCRNSVVDYIFSVFKDELVLISKSNDKIIVMSNNKGLFIEQDVCLVHQIERKGP